MIRLGCSGWDYEDWIGTLYRMKSRSKLAAYSAVFNSVEINSTFYSYPAQGTVLSWLKRSPEDFVFTAKIPRLITHEKLLRGAEGDLKRFCELMLPLQNSGKLGCLLIQLPPKLKFDFNLTRSFFEILPEAFKFAIEFREPSWICREATELLRDFGVAFTAVDEPLLPPVVTVTSKFAYFRWHGLGSKPWYNYRYSREELEPWIPKIKEVSTQVDAIYGYFNNHYHGYAPENCIEVMEMLGIATPEQKRTLDNIREYREKKAMKPALKSITLMDFTEAEHDSREHLLQHFIDEDRLRRAQKIKDEELIIETKDDTEIKASLGEYIILIDLSNKSILHNCADWNKCLESKSFCKHLGKLMLYLPENKAKEILRQIYSERKVWEFRLYAQKNQ